MIFDNEKISARQLYCIIVLDMVGGTCLLSTDISVRYAGNQGILCILLASLSILLYSLLIILICSKTEWNFRKFVDTHLNRTVKKMIYGIFLIKYFIMLVLTVAVMLRFLRNEMLRDVSYGMVFLAVLLVMGYSATQSIEARGRLAEYMIYFIVIPAIVLAILGIRDINTDFVFFDIFDGLLNSAVKKSPVEMLTGTIRGAAVLLFAFSPVEMLVFISDKITTYKDSGKIGENSKVRKAVISAIITVIIFNIIYYIIITGNLSISLVRSHYDSFIRFTQHVKMPYLIFEKQGGLFIIFFVISIYFAIFSLSYHVTELVNLLFGEKVKRKKRMKIYIPIFILMVFGSVNFIASQNDYFKSVKRAKENRIEIEYRKYADCMLIDYDKTQKKYKVMLSFRGDGGLNKFTVYEADHLYEIKEINSKSSNRKLDFSHIQTVILNNKIIQYKKLYADTIKYIEEETELSDNLNICATNQSAEEFAENAMELTTQPGIYISNMIENNIRYAGTKFLELILVDCGSIDSCKLSLFKAESGKIEFEGRIVVYH